MTPRPAVRARVSAVRARVPARLARAAGRTTELITFTGLPDDAEHLTLLAAPWSPPTPLVRLHSECLTGDVFGSLRCDCGPQLQESLDLLAQHGGALLYLRQEGRGIGLYNKLDTYLLQDEGTDTFEANRRIGRGADERDYRTAAAMLMALNLPRIRLLTNNPDKARQLTAYGIEVTGTVPTVVHRTPDNTAYLEAKARAGHHLARPDAETAV
ncbi:GTP cyclohydrolase II [Streptomyces sp. NPDC057621]|uniref:GTP cyclohydrolase II n=1 Tax=Streptomyces sp. NPDC057621 TaxID=3346186 RepID=UPI00367CEA11